MNENVIVTFHGQPALSARIVLRRGGEASTCDVVLPPGAAPAIGTQLHLQVRDAGTQRAFVQFTCIAIERLADGRCLVHGADRRHAWHGRVAALTPLEAGNLDDALRTLFRSAGLDDAPAGGGTLPTLPRLRGPLGALAEQLCALAGLTIGVNDGGDFVFASADVAAPHSPNLLLSREADAAPSEIVVVGSQPLQLRTLAEWEPVIPAQGEWQPLAQVLQQWGITDAKARQACLSEGGFARLIGESGLDATERAAVLSRHAFRAFRAVDAQTPWLPVGGWAGAPLPPRLETRASRPIAAAPAHPADAAFKDAGFARAIEGFEIDLECGVIVLDQPPYLHAADTPGDPTFQSRRLVGEPQLRLTIAMETGGEAFRFTLPGEGTPRVISAPHLTPLHDEEGTAINADALNASARELAEALAASTPRRESRHAGVVGTEAFGAVESVTVSAGEEGLVTDTIESPLPGPAFAPASPTAAHATEAVAPATPPHQPINAWRAGPLILRAGQGVDEAEAVIAMEATARQATGALSLDHPGALAFPFFLESGDASKFGRWFFVAGAEVTQDGRVRVLPDDRHAPLDAEPLAQTRRRRPEGMRGLLLSLGGEPRFVESAPLISDTRGVSGGEMSDIVADIDASRISERRRGSLHMLTVLALSPVSGWAPVLNFRDGKTGNHALHGRGLFAEGDGHSLGRLAAPGGPVFADAQQCSKHSYGVAADDGLYRECAGHLSTEALFKAPGDAERDAPLTFYREPFAGRVPPWPPHEAQIKYHEQGGHEWDGKPCKGRWKIQYRVPFLPEIPETWRPPILPPDEPPPQSPPGDPPPDDPPRVPVPILPPEEIVPVVSENEIWAPSHDWLPAPSDRQSNTPVPFPGPSIKSEGWAGESEGYPDPAEGGGCIFLPPDRIAPDGNDSGERKTWLLLHSEVSLGFGHAGVLQGSLINGWAVQLAQEGQLVFTPVDEEGDAIEDNSRALEIDAPVSAAALNLTAQTANPGGAATLWAHSDGSARWGAGQLAMVASLAGMLRTAIVAYTGSGETGKTVVLTGINRAHALVVMGRADGRVISLSLPAGLTGEITFKDAGGSNESSFSLDAPSAGVSQTLTIDNALDDFNATDEEYDVLVFGT